MTTYQAGTTDFSTKTVTLFNDFLVDVAPFSFNISATGATPGCNNNNSQTAAGRNGTALINTPGTAATSERRYAGIYAAPAVAAGAAIDATYRAGYGTIVMTARMYRTGTSSNNVIWFGLSTTTIPASATTPTEFAGFCANGTAPYWHMSVNRGGSLLDAVTTQDPGVYSVLRVVVDAKSKNTYFYVDGRLVRRFESGPLTTVPLVPCIVVADTSLSGGSSASAEVDFFRIEQEVTR